MKDNIVTPAADENRIRLSVVVPAFNEQDNIVPLTEEIIAAAGTLGFSAPAAIRGDNILVGGVQFVFANVEPPVQQATTPYASFAAAGQVIASDRDRKSVV